MASLSKLVADGLINSTVYPETMMDITIDDRCALCVYSWLASNPRINVARILGRSTGALQCTNIQHLNLSDYPSKFSSSVHEEVQMHFCTWD